MSGESRRIRFKTLIFTIIVILSNAIGDLFLTLGVKQHTAELSLSPVAYIAAMFSPWVATGIALLIVWMLTRMALFGWADLSFVLPVTSVGYVLTAVLGKVVLNEEISAKRWLGTALIVAGTAVVGRTTVRTTEDVPAKPVAGRTAVATLEDGR